MSMGHGMPAPTLAQRRDEGWGTAKNHSTGESGFRWLIGRARPFGDGGGREFYIRFAQAVAWRTWPPDFFRAALAWARVTPAASITSATGVGLPAAARVRRAVSRSAPVTRSRIPMAR